MLQRSTVYVYTRDTAVHEPLSDLFQGFGMVPTFHEGDISRATIDAAQWRIPPNFLIVESTEYESVVRSVELLAEAAPEGMVYMIVLGRSNDVRLYRDLKALGVSEYMLLPLDMKELGDVLEEIDTRRAADLRYPPDRVAAFVGAKGGVGASTLAAMAAWHSAEDLSKRTLLIDCDIQLGMQDILFDLDQNGRPTNLYTGILDQPERIDGQIIDRAMERLDKPKHLNILSASLPMENATYSPEALDLILSSVHASIDSFVLDVPARNPFGLGVLLKAGLVFIVMTLDFAAVRNALAIKQFLAQNNYGGEVRIVFNRKGEMKVGELSVSDVEKKLGFPAIVLPFDQKSPGQALVRGASVLTVPGPLRSAFLEQIAPHLPHGAAPRKKSLISRILNG